MQVLIVDDNESELALTGHVLAKAGYEVVTASSGEEALAIVSTGTCRLVVSDWSMPQMTGPELCRAIRARNLNAYVYLILLTGREGLQEKLEGFSAGADDFITKQFNPGELVARIRIGERVLKAGEAELREEIAERKRADESLKTREHQQAAVAQLGQLALSNIDLLALLDEACRVVATTLDAEYSAVMNLLPDGLTFVLRAGRGWKPDMVGLATMGAGPETQAGCTVQNSEPIVVEDLATDYRFSKQTFLHDHGVVSGVSVSIDANRLFGVLSVHTAQKRVFTAHDIHFLQAIGNVLAAAVDRHQTEEALRHSEEQFRLVVDGVHDYSIIMLDCGGRVVSWNAGAQRIHGYQAEEIIGRHFACFYPEEDARNNKPAKGLSAAEAEGRFEEEGWRVCKNGTRFWANVVTTALRDEMGILRGFSKITRDITEHHSAQRELLFQKFALDQHAIVAVMDPNGDITYVNDKICELSKYSREEWLGKNNHILDAEQHSKEFLRRLHKQITHGDVWRGELRNRAKDGGVYWMDTTIVPAKDEAGRIVQYVSICSDITARKLAEESLAIHQKDLERANRELERKNERLSELYQTAQRFVDNVSHEFRTPLTVIKGYTEAISKELAGPVNEAQKEYLGFILDRTGDLAQMVDDLLDSSKLRAGTLRVDRRPHRVEKVFAQIRPMLMPKAATNKIQLIEQIEPDLPEVFADAEKVGRVIINLVVNAIKFSPENGRVLLWARRNDEGGVAIGVTDQGAGIAQENLAEIFERFKQVGDPQRSSTKGFGLGLNIAHELVALNLGEITVVSKLREGSTFSFTLPPNEPRAVLSRYLDYLQQAGNPEDAVALLRAEPVPPSPVNDRLRSLIASTVRPTELVLEGADGRSLLIVGRTQDAERWRQRLEQSVEAIYSQSVSASAKPVIRFEQLAVWTYPAGRQQMEARILEELHGELIHA